MSKKNNRYAVVDIGTNSARLLIYEPEEGSKIRRIDKFVRYTRMGQDVNKTRKLCPEAMERNLAALKEYKMIAAEYGVNDPADIDIFGTSAMRDAQNTDEFIQSVKEKLNLTVKVIPGADEADLGFKGVAQCFEDDILVFDIGGGSTELIWGGRNAEGQKVVKKMQSMNIGCVRSTEKHIHNDPPTSTELAAIKAEASENIQKVLATFGDYSFRTLVGIGGTATTLGTIKQCLDKYDSEKIHQSVITKQDVDDILVRLAVLPLAERQKVIGLDAGRADIIIAGICILQAIMEVTNQTIYTICDYDNLEGKAVIKHQLLGV